MVRVRPWTPFPSCFTRWLTLRRLLRCSGLAGGFRQAKKFCYVVAFEVNLAFPSQDVCLVAGSGYATPASTTGMARLVDTSWR